ncbi:tRNA threonylcarbamoyladenosine dehydratase [Halosquirtibacter xylanolyticus]|uniref:tRNA threonylcarbamoyladenosine dehydratase n=1 Tax=Halosquirtibacter xylanolyticus TaxID=3374599 RepID=UPI003748D466|nr:tRNA threonylcarbamoyladenosine dehydratase [Prolixibacteraceae bacterium]
MNWFRRTEILVGDKAMQDLRDAHVIVIGLGGVGAYAAESICRAGVGRMTLVDGDTVDESNRNRQLPALLSTNGKPKAEVLRDRFIDINPEIVITVVNRFIRDDQTVELLESGNYDCVVDCIDTLSPKVNLLRHCVERGIPIVSSMGAGGKFDPTQIEIVDISESYNCKLARQVRKRLGKFNIRQGIPVVFSPEEVEISKVIEEKGQNKASVVGTISYMPPAFGCAVASIVLRKLLNKV